MFFGFDEELCSVEPAFWKVFGEDGGVDVAFGFGPPRYGAVDRSGDEVVSEGLFKGFDYRFVRLVDFDGCFAVLP